MKTCFRRSFVCAIVFAYAVPVFSVPSAPAAQPNIVVSMVGDMIGLSKKLAAIRLAGHSRPIEN